MQCGGSPIGSKGDNEDKHMHLRAQNLLFSWGTRCVAPELIHQLRYSPNIYQDYNDSTHEETITER